MVRLKDNIEIGVEAQGAFQFHYGTIKSLQLHPLSLVHEISIPLWYD